MYAFLRKNLGKRSSIVITAFIYAVMILLVMYSAFEPHAELKYIAL